MFHGGEKKKGGGAVTDSIGKPIKCGRCPCHDWTPQRESWIVCICGHAMTAHDPFETWPGYFDYYDHDADFPGKEPPVIWTLWLIMAECVDIVKDEWTRWRRRARRARRRRWE